MRRLAFLLALLILMLSICVATWKIIIERHIEYAIILFILLMMDFAVFVLGLNASWSGGQTEEV